MKFKGSGGSLWYPFPQNPYDVMSNQNKIKQNNAQRMLITNQSIISQVINHPTNMYLSVKCLADHKSTLLTEEIAII